jgi:hypothetical protein
LNTKAEHQDRVIESLDVTISAQVSDELQEMKKRTQALKVQEASQTSKGIAMKSFTDKKQSPQHQIEIQTVAEHFRKTCAQPKEDFRETRPDSQFFLELKITERDEGQGALESFMLNHENIKEMIRSREDLNARGVDRISYRIMKRAGATGVKFMKLLIRACEVEAC